MDSNCIEFGTSIDMHKYEAKISQIVLDSIMDYSDYKVSESLYSIQTWACKIFLISKVLY